MLGGINADCLEKAICHDVASVAVHERHRVAIVRIKGDSCGCLGLIPMKMSSRVGTDAVLFNKLSAEAKAPVFESDSVPSVRTRLVLGSMLVKLYVLILLY